VHGDCMTLDPAQLPNDIESLKAMLLAENKRANDLATRASYLDAEIENLKLTIAKLQHARFGPSSERRSVLLEQLELQLDELEAQRAQYQAAAEIAQTAAAGPTPQTEPKPRRKPARRPLPQNLPRERRVQPAPTSCQKCGGSNLRKIGEDVTETPERVPAQWKVVEHVCENFGCRTCDGITQPLAPSHPIARGRAGPNLLAEILSGKYGAHLPLNRQSDIFAHEGV